VLTVNEISDQLIFSVFPNPNNGQFTLALSGETGTIEIYNVLGEKVFLSEINKQKSWIDLSNHPHGIYFVKLCSGQNVVTKKIFIR
jgi:hypothetical protein